MQPLQKSNRPVGSPPQSSNLPHFTETAIYQGQPAGHNVISPYNLNGVQFNDGPQQFEKIRQYNNSESMRKHDDQQRGQYSEFFSPGQHDPPGSHPQIRNSQAPFYNNTTINDFNISAAQENSQQQLSMQQMQQQQQQQQLWQYQYHQKMQQQSSDPMTHAQMVRQAELNQAQQQQYQRQFTGQDSNFAVYPTQVGSHPMQSQTPDTMKATNHSSIFSGNHEFSTSTCSQFNTPDTQRQSQHQVFDSNVNTMSFYDQSAISTPQKGLLFQQVGQNTQTPIKGMNAPDFDPKRAQNKQSTAKAEQLTPNYLVTQKDDFGHENLTPQSIFHPSHSQIDSNHLILQTLASPSPAKAMYQQQAQLIAGSPAEQAFYYQNQHLLMQQRSLTKFEQQQMQQQNAQLQQQQQLIQHQSFLSQQQQPGNIPQFQHTSENISPRQQTFPGPFQLSEHSSSTTSLQLQQVQPMFANLQIGGSSEAKPSSLMQNSRLPHQDNSVFKVDDGCLHMDQNGLQKQRCSAHGKQGCGHGDQPSRRDGLIRHTNGGASKGQQQAVAANLTENASDDQIANSLISRLQKLPPSATWKDKEILLSGKVTNLATTQSGSRYLQNQLLAKSSPPLIEFLLEQVGQTLSTIMINQYGNYFFQKLLTNCSVDQRLHILHLIQNDFIKICCHKQGTHTIQTIFDNVTMDQEENFIKNALQGHVYDLSIDQQGTHVIRKVLQCKSFDEEKQAFIFDEIFAQLNELCLNKNGLCVIKIIIALTKTTRQKQRVIEQISHNLIKLVSDPYGNYAVSQIIEKWEQTVCKPIFDILATKIFELSNQKFSSCVIEKCLQYGDSQTRSNFIRKISESERLGALVSHSFGNFVIQTALEKAQGHEKEDLIQAIYRSFPQISDKKIRDKWQLITKDATEDRFRSEDRQYYDQDDYQNSPDSVHGSRHQAMSYNDHNHHYAQSHQQAHYQEQSFNSNPHREQWSDRGHYNSNPAGSQQQFEYRQKQQQQRSTQNQNQNQHQANVVGGQKKQQRHHQNNQHASRRGGGQTTMSKQQSHGAVRDYSDSYTNNPIPSQHKSSQQQYQVSQEGGSYRSPRQHQANGGNMNQPVKNGHGGKNEGGRGGTKLHKNGNGFYGRGGHQGNTNASGNFYQPTQNSGASRKHQNEAKDCY